MGIEEIKVKKSQSEQNQKAMLERINQLDQEKQQLLQEILKIDGEIRAYNGLIASEEKPIPEKKKKNEN